MCVCGAASPLWGSLKTQLPLRALYILDGVWTERSKHNWECGPHRGQRRLCRVIPFDSVSPLNHITRLFREGFPDAERKQAVLQQPHRVSVISPTSTSVCSVFFSCRVLFQVKHLWCNYHFLSSEVWVPALSLRAWFQCCMSTASCFAMYSAPKRPVVALRWEIYRGAVDDAPWDHRFWLCWHHYTS